MDKLTKGLLAAGLGGALLIGGGTTLAYWTDDASVDGAGITAGTLEITAAPTADDGWTVTHGTTTTDVAAIAALRIVPGDTLTHTSTYTLTAVGDNLRIDAQADDATIAPATSAAADVALAARLAADASVTVDGTPIADFVATTGTHDVVISVALTWPFDGSGSPAADNAARGGAVDLDDFAVTVRQVQG
ncbi:alternate-type signal peptide domain-containing protein [Sanguibacter sp. HDW7]|uniref:alternate-type signal peptide domain-containing protein n=1 Tax=Sanguibacter sp. HDW7 TaxID=2714931 RepID=UPI001407289A|nr:alternate-type signal peptide domain-containing protein [Sanguibacter sp. HDW7]QIK82185.1 alternate-type signal peptide domain-containing protein [Sanguibacter sp. HDW7]